MKLMTLVVIIVIVACSCTKNTESNPLIGTWLLDSVYSITATPPRWFDIESLDSTGFSDPSTLVISNDGTLQFSTRVTLRYELMGDTTIAITSKDADGSSYTRQYKYEITDRQFTFYENGPEITISKYRRVR